MSRRKSKKTAQGSVGEPVVMVKRNPVAANPLLGKSGAHGKTRKADRRAQKVSLRKLPLERAAYRRCVIDHRLGQAFGSSGNLNSVISAAA